MPRFIAPAVAFAVLALAACSADSKDFQEQGEKFIEGDEIRERLGGVRMSDAECEEPATTDEDTIYSCTATGSDENVWAFQIEITGSTSLRVISAEVAVPASGSGTSVPESTDSTASTAASGATDAPTTTIAATTTTTTTVPA